MRYGGTDEAVTKQAEGILPLVSDLVGFELSEVSGRTAYPRGGWMGWHSNSNRPGRRAYCIWNEHENASFFRWAGPGDHLHTDCEPRGWLVRTFEIPPSPGRLWHCVWAGGPRFALGFWGPSCAGATGT